MKKIKMLAVFLMVVFMLTACGSSSGGSAGSNGYSKTYTKTGTSYSDDAGNTYYGNWTDRTTITISGDKTQVRIFQEEVLNGNPAFVHETIYIFSKPIVTTYFVENYNEIDSRYSKNAYGMSIVTTGGTTVTAKMCELQKSRWTENSAQRAKLWVDTGSGNGAFYNSYYLTSGSQYHVFAEHYDPALAAVVTYIDVK